VKTSDPPLPVASTALASINPLFDPTNEKVKA
jgi:hypothetical protein